MTPEQARQIAREHGAIIAPSDNGAGAGGSSRMRQVEDRSGALDLDSELDLPHLSSARPADRGDEEHSVPGSDAWTHGGRAERRFDDSRSPKRFLADSTADSDTSADSGPDGGSLRRKPLRDPRTTATDPSPANQLRYAQKIFRQGNPTLFGSHAGAIGSDYELGPGDEIILTLWGQKEARYLLTLDRDGQINIEGIGVVSLNGLSLREADKLLRSRLARIYSGMRADLVQMDVTMGKLKQIRVFVVGDAVAPGGYMLSGNTTVFSALYQAKGPSDLGTERRIEIIRAGNDRREIDLYDYLLRGRRPARDNLHDGDIIRIPRRGAVVEIAGEIGRPGRYELLPTEDAKDLLQFAGGLLPTTASQEMTVLRVFENGRADVVALPRPQELVSSGEAAPLQDGDQVTVFKGRDPGQRTVIALGEVRFPGSYPHEDGMTLADLVRKAGGPTIEAFLPRVLVRRIESDGTASLRSSPLTPDNSLALRPNDQLVVYNRFRMATERTVRISGEVHQPGTYAFQSGMTVKDLILKAGGFASHPDYRSIRVELPLMGQSISRVDVLQLDSLLSTDGADHPLTDGAHVAVPKDPNWNPLDLVVLDGHFVHPGTYSLLQSDERVSSVIARAGGLLSDAYPEAALFLRSHNSTGRIQINLPMALAKPGTYEDLPMRAGDTLIMPTRPATVEVTGRIYHPTHVIWRKGKSWRWYVQMAGGLADSADVHGIYVQYADGSIQTNRDGIEDPPNPGSKIIVPFKAPDPPTKFTDAMASINAVLATVIAGLTIFVLIDK